VKSRRNTDRAASGGLARGAEIGSPVRSDVSHPRRSQAPTEVDRGVEYMLRSKTMTRDERLAEIGRLLVPEGSRDAADFFATMCTSLEDLQAPNPYTAYVLIDLAARAENAFRRHIAPWKDRPSNAESECHLLAGFFRAEPLAWEAPSFRGRATGALRRAALGDPDYEKSIAVLVSAITGGKVPHSAGDTRARKRRQRDYQVSRLREIRGFYLPALSTSWGVVKQCGSRGRSLGARIENTERALRSAGPRPRGFERPDSYRDETRSAPFQLIPVSDGQLCHWVAIVLMVFKGPSEAAATALSLLVEAATPGRHMARSTKAHADAAARAVADKRWDDLEAAGKKELETLRKGHQRAQ